MSTQIVNNPVSREEFLEVTNQIKIEITEMKIEIAEIKKDILHLCEKIDSISNVRSWVIAIGATTGAITGLISMIKLFLG